MADKKNKNTEEKSAGEKEKELKKKVKKQDTKPSEKIQEKNKKQKKSQETEEKIDEKEIENQNKILKGVLIVIGVIIVFIIAWVVISKMVSSFEYENLEFQVIQEGDLIFYQTSLPTMYQGQLTEYNFYLRNDARKLSNKVDFQGDLDLKSNAVLNLQQEFNCEGKGVIAVANLLKLYEFIGIEVITNENLTCDEQARYTHIEIIEGNETKIETTGQSCYKIHINDCEILQGTERMMIEILSKVKSTL